MNPTTTKPIPKNIMGLFDDGREEDFETEGRMGDAFTKAFEGAEFILNPVASGLGDIAKETTSAIEDLFKDIFSPMESKGKIDNFQDPEKQKDLQEGQRQKMIYSSMDEARRNTQSAAHEAALDMAVRLEVASMSSVQKNAELNLNLDYAEKNINDPYHISELMRKMKAQMQAAQQENQDESLAAVTKGPALRGRLDAQEGQSLVSSSGAILGAG